MDEQEKFRMDVEIVSEALSRRSCLDDTQAEAGKLYEKFCVTGQEPVKLAIALRCFFMEQGPDEEQRRAYGQYLKKRIRPAAEQLIEEEGVEQLACLEQQGWISENLLETFIRRARERGKTASLVWLLHLKNEKYGYKDKDFSL